MVELKWVRFREYYFPYFPPRTPGHRDLAILTQYYLLKRPGIDIEELISLVGEGAALEQDEKVFVRTYIERKLKPYGFVKEFDDRLYPTYPFLTVMAIKGMIHAHEERLKVYFSERTIRAWKRGERFPDLKKLMEVLQ